VRNYRFLIFIVLFLLVGCGSKPDPAIITLAEAGVSSNDEWEPYIQKFNGVEMALVPAGCFMMGSTEEEIDMALDLCNEAEGANICERGRFEIEAPQHEICFDAPFWIDVYEVTNKQYGTPSKNASSYSPGKNHPQASVDWFIASEYCESRGARLPTEAEWEYAARGPDGLIYPWGNTFDGSLLNFCDKNCVFNREADQSVDDGYENAAPVGSYPGGVSWVGAYDLSGNVFEWTSSHYMLYPYDASDGREDSNKDSNSIVVTRGGSWAFDASFMRSTLRTGVPPDQPGAGLTGFRCARSQ
jgi:formylglycine-generating enzyme required for sulfatase activity